MYIDFGDIVMSLTLVTTVMKCPTKNLVSKNWTKYLLIQGNMIKYFGDIANVPKRKMVFVPKG